MSDQQTPPEAVITSSYDQYQVFALVSWIEANNYDPFVHIATRYPGVRLPAHEMAKSVSVINLASRACGKFRWHENHIEVAQRFGGQDFTCLIPYRSIALAMFRGTSTATVLPWAVALPGGRLAVEMPPDVEKSDEVPAIVGMDPGVEGGDRSVAAPLPAPVTEALKALDTSEAAPAAPRMRGHLRVVK